MRVVTRASHGTRGQNFGDVRCRRADRTGRAVKILATFGAERSVSAQVKSARAAGFAEIVDRARMRPRRAYVLVVALALCLAR